MSGHHHRPNSSLKQANKGHKTGGHSTKRELMAVSKGRVEKSSVTGSASTGKKSLKSMLGGFGVIKRADRLNRAKQLVEQKRLQALVEKRLAGGFGPPKQVVIFGLSEHSKPESIAALLLAHADAIGVSTSAQAIGCPVAAVYNGLRQRLLVLIAPRPGQSRFEPGLSPSSMPFQYDVTHAVAAAQAADVLLLVCDMARGPAACIDAAGDLFLSCLKATGMPSVIGIVTGLEEGSVAMRTGGVDAQDAAAGTGGEGQGASIADLRRYAGRLLHTELGNDKEECRIVEVTEPTQCHVPADVGPVDAPFAAGVKAAVQDGSVLALARAVSAVNPRSITWRGHRSYLTAMHAEWVPEAPAGEALTGTLKLHGYLRGRPLNAGQLVTLARGGTYALSSVTAPPLEGQPFRALSRGGAPAVAQGGAGAGRQPTAFCSLLQSLASYGTRVQLITSTTSSGSSGTVAEEEVISAPAEGGETPCPIATDVDVDAGEQTWPEEGMAGGENGGARRMHTLDEEMDEEEEDGDEDEVEGDEEEADRALAEAAAATYDTGALVGLDKGSAEYASAVGKLKSEAVTRAAEERQRLQSKSRRARLVRAGKAVPEEGEGEEDDGKEEDGDDASGADGDEDLQGDSSLPEEEDVEEEVEGEGKGAADPDSIAVRTAAEKDACDFPDEIDTPLQEPARLRFARYRGLKSFRTTAWDKEEGLPSDYAHIYSLAKFHRTQARVLSEGNLATRALLTLEGSKVAQDKAHRRQKGASAKAKQAAERGASRAGSVAGSVAGAGAGAGGDGDEDMDGDGADMQEDGVVSRPATVAGFSDAGVELRDLLGPGWVGPGRYVCLHLTGVPAAALADAACLPHIAVTATGSAGVLSLPGLPLTAFSLLKHEGRATVVHTTLTRWPGYTLPVKGRDSLEVYTWGSRVTDARPVFSGVEPTLDRARVERFMQRGQRVSAAYYGHVAYTPAPLLVFRRVPLVPIAQHTPAGAAPDATAGSGPAPLTVGVPPDASVLTPETACRHALAHLYPAPDRISADEAGRTTRLVLVALGHVTGADPDRLLLKRTVLTGFPVKVEGRSAVARAMFFYNGDIDWFKPLAVYTKGGAQGHITMSIGTHGRMKLRFDRPITQADVICLPLYKRVFPRWGRGFLAAFPQLAAAEARDAGRFDAGIAREIMATTVEDQVDGL